MLSDTLFDIQERLKSDITHYSSHPFSKSYPDSQKENLILSLYHLKLAQMAYDSVLYPDNHTFDIQSKMNIMDDCRKIYEECVKSSKINY